MSEGSFHLEVKLPDGHPALARAPHVFQMPVGDGKGAVTMVLPDDPQFFEAIGKTLDAWKFFLVKQPLPELEFQI